MRLLVLIICAFLLSACEENTGRIGGAFAGTNGNNGGTNQNTSVYIESDKLTSLETMTRRSRNSVPRNCRDFRSRESVTTYNLFGMKLSNLGSFTEVSGQRSRILDLQNNVMARLLSDSTFEFTDYFLKASFNPFNHPLRGTFITGGLFVINLKSSPTRGNIENQPGAIVFEELSYNEFENLNASLTLHCR